MVRRAFSTLSDAIAVFESDNHSQEQDLVLFPPLTDGYVSDKEVRDDDISMQGTFNFKETLLGS